MQTPPRQQADLNLSLVAGRRPDLLERTLASFDARLFRHFRIGTVLVNIDPWAGGAAEQDRCRALVLDMFPEARVFEPETAGFGAAVKRLWSQLPDGLAFHFEDDWTAEQDIPPERVLPLFEGRTRAVVPLSLEHRWPGGSPFKTHVVKTRLFGRTIWRRRAGTFGTSPRFIDGAFARCCGALMDPTLDPEKQMYLPHNEKLHDYMAPYANRLLPARDGGPLITDIGRDWRERRGMAKVLEGARSSWVDAR